MGSCTGNRRASWLATGAALVSLAWPIAATADDEPQRDPQVAQSLFNRARTLMDQGSFAEACPMLAESQRLDPGGGTLLNLAVCLEGAGKLASAEAKFQEALSQAIRDKRDDRQKIAEERIRAIEPRLSKLTIEVAVASRVRGLRVSLDGSRLPDVAWGVPITVDGGEHRVEATAPGHDPRRMIVKVGNEGDAPTVKIELSPSAPRTVATRKRKPRVFRPVSVAGWTLVGSGIGFAATGIALGVSAVIVDDTAERDAQAEGCNLARNYCPNGSADDFAARAEMAQALGWAATTTSIVGAALLLIGPFQRRARTITPAMITPAIAPTESGATAGVNVTF